MGIDLAKLPWRCFGQIAPDSTDMGNLAGRWVLSCRGQAVAFYDDEAECEKAALRANAEEVMMRRGWGVTRTVGDGFAVCCHDPWRKYSEGWGRGNDPFTALVQADQWMKDNCESPTNPQGS